MTVAANPTDMTLTDMASAIRRRQLSAVEVSRACLSRIEAGNPLLNCFIEIDPERLLEEAAVADSELAHGAPRGPLHGVPLAHKDMFYRAGRTASCGSGAAFLRPAAVTATVLSRLDDAGALCAGALHMSEFAVGPTGHNERYGACRNPWHTDHAPGGSSSGSGAAVAARMIFGSLGSDTGGSIRLPAAACGIVGLKPTNGRVTRYGAMPRAWSLDTVGPLARTVADAALLLGVIAGPDDADPTSSSRPTEDYVAAAAASPAGLRVGVAVRHGLDAAKPEIQEIVGSALEMLRDAGLSVVEIQIPDPAAIFPLADAIAKSEAATIHGRGLRDHPECYSAHARARMDAGFHIPASRYLEAQSLRGRYLRLYRDTVFSRVDAVLMPALPIPVPRLDELRVGDSGAVPDLVSALTLMTRHINYLGLPALALPCGFSASGLPVGLQLLGRPFAEATLMIIGQVLQDAIRFHERKPPVPRYDGSRDTEALPPSPTQTATP